MSRNHPNVTLSPFQLQVVLGTLLGDSSLSRPATGKNYHLSCYHAEAQREWLIQKHNWLSPASRPIQWCSYTDKRDGKTRPGGRFHTVSIPCFTRLAPLLYDGERTKIIADAFLALITDPVALACLICDDGSWDQAGISIASKQFTVEENDRLASFLAGQFGLDAYACTGGKYPNVRISAASVERVRQLCLPFVPDILRYKFGPDDYRTRLVGKVKRTCACGTPFVCYESSERRFCSPACGNKGKAMGYTTRTKTSRCGECGQEFTPYNRLQVRCRPCRGR